MTTLVTRTCLTGEAASAGSLRRLKDGLRSIIREPLGAVAAVLAGGRTALWSALTAPMASI